MSIRQITVITDLRLLTRKERRPGIEDIRLAAYRRARERERERERDRETETETETETERQRQRESERAREREREQRKRHYYQKDTAERDRCTQVYRDREGYTEGLENEEGT